MSTDPLSTVVYKPHPRQEAFHRDPRAWRWFAAGYGCGKSSATAIEALVNATTRHPGYTGIVCAPTYTLLTQSWLGCWKALVPRAWWELRQGGILGARLIVNCPGGQKSTILLRSTTNPTGLEGVNAAWAVFDEATREPDANAFDVLVSRVREGFPGRQRSVILSGPPATRRHWSAVEFGSGPDAKHTGDMLGWHDSQRAVIRARTRDNPYLPSGYEAALRARPGVSRAWCSRWLDAEFGVTEAQIYGCFSRDVHVVSAASLQGRQWRRIIVGVDWGYSHPGVMLVCAQDGYGDIFVIAEEVHTEKPVTEDGWISIARNLDREFRPDAFAYDPSAPASGAAIKKGVRGRVFGASNNVAEGIRVVTAHLERAVDRAKRSRTIGKSVVNGPPALYISDACVNTIGEFESYSRKKLRDGSLSEEPTDTGDDAMDALRYAVMALSSRSLAA